MRGGREREFVRGERDGVRKSVREGGERESEAKTGQESTSIRGPWGILKRRGEGGEKGEREGEKGGGGISQKNDEAKKKYL